MRVGALQPTSDKRRWPNLVGIKDEREEREIKRKVGGKRVRGKVDNGKEEVVKEKDKGGLNKKGKRKKEMDRTTKTTTTKKKKKKKKKKKRKRKR